MRGDDCENVAVEACASEEETGAAIDSAEVRWLADDGERLLKQGSAGSRAFSHDNLDTARFSVSAPGYEMVTFAVEIEHDVCGEVVGEKREVSLSREVGGSHIVRGESLEGC